MDVCILNQAGEIVGHRHLPTSPEALLRTIAPYREPMVIAVECLFTWYWLADVCARVGIPVVLGHALSMKAMHGDQAKHDPIDAQNIAVLLRGGMLPQASVDPAERRATRDLLRRRMPLMHQRAAWLTHIQHPNSQYNLPEIGKKLADKANRDGVAARFPNPAVQKSIAVDLALIDPDDRLLRDRELALLQSAKPHEANTRSRLRTLPGIGELLRLVLRYERHDIQRVPRVQDVVSYGRLVTCAKASAGNRYGTSGTKSGHAYRPWACSEAAVLCLRAHPAGQKDLTRLERNHGQGTAFTVLAQKRARAVYDMFKRAVAFDMEACLHQEEAARASPTPHWTCLGSA